MAVLTWPPLTAEERSDADLLALLREQVAEHKWIDQAPSWETADSCGGRREGLAPRVQRETAERWGEGP